MKLKTNTLPGGIRTVEMERPVVLARPWQSKETVPEGCPFCSAPPQSLKEKDGWIASRNKSPIYPKSYLLRPRGCRADFKPESDIRAAYALAEECIAPGKDYWLLVKQGGLSGQTVRHLHFHLIEHQERKIRAAFRKLASREMPLVFGAERFAVCAGGHRVGQCFVLPKSKDGALEIGEAADALGKLIQCARRTLQSLEGLPPEFQITLSLTGKHVRYATYLPVLYQFGVELVALLEGRALHLPWSHAEMAKHLRGAL